MLAACLLPVLASAQDVRESSREPGRLPVNGGARRFPTFPDDLPPLAALSATPSRVVGPVAVTLDATASFDPEGSSLRYRFDFGDGSASTFQDSPIVTHVFPPGRWTVTVTVIDATDRAATAQRTVISNTVPTAALAPLPASGPPPLVVTLDASGSIDADGDSLLYAFDFGDGATAGPQSSPSASHAYASGLWFPMVTVIDHDGAEASAGAMVTVNGVPVPVLAVDPVEGIAPLEVIADGSASWDPDGEPLVFWVDFGDGVTLGPLFDPVAIHKYAPGTWTVSLSTADEWGARDTVTATVTVHPPPNRPPLPVLHAIPSAGLAPLDVELDASGSHDPDGSPLSYLFDFGDGVTFGPSSVSALSHVYGPGTWTARVTVIDDSAATATASTVIRANAAPVPAVVATPERGEAPLAVTIDASASADPEGGTLRFRFEFGDGTTIGPQGSPIATHTYAAGRWRVLVTVTDSAGAAAAASDSVIVNGRPLAELRASPAAGTAPLVVTLDASTSSDPEGGRLLYRFETGDGAVIGPQSQPFATHPYAAGLWTARVTVTDSAGAATADTVTVAVNARPTAALAATPDTGYAPLAVTLDASASFDPDGGPLSYRFDFGDGAFVGPQAAPAVTHAYAAGTWIARVRVTDPQGDSAVATASIRVALPPNQLPTAVLNAAPASGVAPLQVTVDAQSSRDPDGSLISYAFDFGDGTSRPAGPSPVASHVYAAGTWIARLTVVDDRGGVAVDSTLVEVNAAPIATLSLDPTEGEDPLTVTANASASFDPEGRPLNFRFDFGDATHAGPQAGSTASHVFSAGSFVVRVTVTDPFGASDTASAALTVRPPPNLPPVPVVEVRLGSLHPDSGFVPLVRDPSRVFPPLAAPRPAYGQRVTDATFATRFARITDLAGVPFTTALGAGTWGADARHHYSKDQPWNSDGTLIAMQNDGSPRQVFLDGATYAPVGAECWDYPRGDDRWHPSPSHPHVRINARGNELIWWDALACSTLRRWTLPFAVKGIGDGEGNPSRDGRYLALCDSSRMFVVDMDPQPPFAPYPNVRIGPVVDFIANCGLAECRLGWVSVSPSGKYVVCKYGGDHPRVYDLNPTTLALTPRPMPEAAPRCSGTAAQGFLYDLGHCDMTLNPFDANEDVLIGQEHCGWRGIDLGGRLVGGVVMARLRDGAVLPLTDPTNEAYPHHISLQNVDRPGWAYVGYYPDPGKRFSDEIVAVRLDGSGAVERFAHKHALTPDCYRCEAHAVPSRDGRRVMWASNWSIDCTTCGTPGEIKAYVVDARADSVPRPPWTAPVTITADASESSDPDGTIAVYTFDFGDGVVAGPQASPLAVHTYGVGTWTLMLTVRDQGGAARSVATPVTVHAPPADRPPAVSAPGVASGRPGDTLVVNVWASDPDGDPIASLTADLSRLPAGHGAVFTASAEKTSGVLRWVPSAPGGPWPVRFVAANSLSAADTTSITVSWSNLPPAASLSASPEFGAATLSCTLSAAASSDPESGGLTYLFDFGDGTVAGPQASSMAVHGFAAGDWLATVTVFDPHGATDQASVLVRALPNLVGNPSFEAFTSGWNANGGGTIARVPGGLDGGWCLEMVGPGQAVSFGVNDSPNWVEATPGGGRRYRFGAWVRSASSRGAARLRVREYLNGLQQGPTIHSSPVTLSPVWSPLTVDVVTSVAGGSLDFQVVEAPESGGESFQVDRVSIALFPPGFGFSVAGPAADPESPAAGAAEQPPASLPSAGARPFSVAVRPHPQRGALVLHVGTEREGPLKIEVFDIRGRRAGWTALRSPPGQHRIAVPHAASGRWPPGMYFYRVRVPEGVRSGRVVVVEP